MSCNHMNSFDLRSPIEKLDERFVAIIRGLDQLQCDGLKRILIFQESGRGIVYDGGNFEPATRRWCPLAIGLGLIDEMNAGTLSVTTDAEAKIAIVREGRRNSPDFHLNPISGIKGQFYSSDRPSDLRYACETILSARGQCETTKIGRGYGVVAKIAS